MACSLYRGPQTIHAFSCRYNSLKANISPCLCNLFPISPCTKWSPTTPVVSMMTSRTIKSDRAVAGLRVNYPRVNRERSIAYWFGPACCVVDGEQTNTNKMNQLEAGRGPPWVIWSRFLISFIIRHSQWNKSATVFCWRRELPQAMLRNAFFLFLDLNWPMLANVFLWIQIPLCCNAHGKAVV